MPQIPEVTVAAIVTDGNADGTLVLLTRRAIEPFAGQWCLPGGHLAPDEPWHEAVCREVKEETGLEIKPRFFGSFAEVIPERQINAVVKVFDGEAVGVPMPDLDEVSQIRWFVLEQALELPLAFRHNEILRAFSARIASPEHREELLAEFAALRAEAVQRLDLRQQALSLALTGAGIFIGFAAGQVADPVALLLFPWLVLAITIMWAHHDVRLGQLGDHIRERIEPRLPGLGWENSLRARYGRLPRFYRAFAESASLGIFVGIDVVCVVTAFLLWFVRQSGSNPSPTPLLVYLILAGLAVVPSALAVKSVRQRRNIYREADRARKRKGVPGTAKTP